jgi:deferrochelatase/peroxidase EfeB
MVTSIVAGSSAPAGAKFDMLNQFATHVGGGLFACPPGAQAGEFVGQRLFVPA